MPEVPSKPGETFESSFLSELGPSLKPPVLIKATPPNEKPKKKPKGKK
jgi:hypothetical protein